MRDYVDQLSKRRITLPVSKQPAIKQCGTYNLDPQEFFGYRTFTPQVGHFTADPRMRLTSPSRIRTPNHSPHPVPTNTKCLSKALAASGQLLKRKEEKCITIKETVVFTTQKYANQWACWPGRYKTYIRLLPHRKTNNTALKLNTQTDRF